MPSLSLKGAFNLAPTGSGNLSVSSAIAEHWRFYWRRQGLINRRRGGRGENTLMRFLLLWRRSPDRCLRSLACRVGWVLPRTFKLPAHANRLQCIPNPTELLIRTFLRRPRAKLFTCAARMCDTHFESREGDLTHTSSSQKTGGTTERQRLVSRFLPDSKRVRKNSSEAEVKVVGPRIKSHLCDSEGVFSLMYFPISTTAPICETDFSQSTNCHMTVKGERVTVCVCVCAHAQVPVTGKPREDLTLVTLLLSFTPLRIK